MICTIFATDQVGTFGNRGTLPWPVNTEDMAWFREHTVNQIVVMGRRTWDDPKMRKPLPDRINCVITNQALIGYPAVRRLSGDYKKQIQDLQDEQMCEETFYKQCIEFISHKEYEDYLVKHNNISDQINMLLKTYAVISTEIARVSLILI